MVLYTDFEIKEFDSAALVGWYQPFGTALSNPCYGAVISNESDTPVYISVDGVTDNFRVGAHITFDLKGLQRHDTLDRGEYLLPKGTQLHIRHNLPPGTGFIVFHALMTR